MKRLTALLLALAAAHASAQTMKPGQWELSNRLKSSNGQTGAAMSAAMKQLANLPPEQRAQIEAMMAQNGATMPKLGADGGMTMSACITPEMAARHEMPTGQQGNCSSSNQPVAGGLNLSFRCTNPPSSGQGTLRFNGDSSFTMTMSVTSSISGQPEQTQVETSGRWLSPTCSGGQR